MNGISRETFSGYDTDSKLDTLFDYVHAIYEQSCSGDAKLEKRVVALERRKRFDTGLSAFMGLAGGMIAAFGRKLIGG